MSTDEISTMWTISVGHLPRHIVDVTDYDVIAYPWGEYGWIVHVPNDFMDELNSGSNALDRIIRRAHDSGYQWVKIDQDGPEVDDLVWFEV